MSTQPLYDRLSAVQSEIQKRRWRDDPVLWIQERLGEHVWSKQKEIAYSVRDHRFTAVHSCHGVGKSFIASRLVGWWLNRHPPGEAFVVTSASTAGQVKAVLWREIGRMQARHGLPGRTNQASWYMETIPGKEELVAFGRKPADFDAAAFQGIHQLYVLIIFDEAAGIPGGSKDNPNSLWEAAISLMSNEFARFLAIGNPDDPSGEFARCCKPGSGWNVIHIDAYDSPNFTGEPIPPKLCHLLVSKLWVEERRKRWGERNPLWIAKVRGHFPETTTDGLIPMAWIKAAQTRSLEPKTDEELKLAEKWENVLGMDVGAGGNRSVVCRRWGPVFRIVRRDQEPDTMKSCGNLLADMRETRATSARVDYIGVGRGVVDRARELERPVIGVNVGNPARDREGFVNLRAEGFWGLRERFQEGTIDLDPEDDDLAAQLVELKFKRTSAGKIQIESKDEMARRGVASPDDADACMLSSLPESCFTSHEFAEVEFTMG